MLRSGIAVLIMAFFVFGAAAQDGSRITAATSKAGVAKKTDTTADGVARSAVEAHGGHKLKQMTSLVMRGSVDLSVFNQRMPGGFAMAFSGDKYSFEIDNPFQPLKQVSNGVGTYSSLQGFSLPPMTSLGFPLLPRVGDKGYAVSELPVSKKRRQGFRVTTPDGFYTDFVTDEKTGRIKGYESQYDVQGRVVTTSVEIDEFQTVEGILVPKRYSQRFDLGGMTAYASFRSREILVNTKIDDEVFVLPK